MTTDNKRRSFLQKSLMAGVATTALIPGFGYELIAFEYATGNPEWWCDIIEGLPN